MRFSPALVFGCLLALAAPLPVHAAWRLETSEARQSLTPAVTHHTVTLRGGRTLEVQLVRFDRSRVTLRVLELAPGVSVAAAAQEARAWAGVNGGYFKADRTPLGLVISQGKTLHPWESSKLLTGVLAVTPKGGASLLRNGEFKEGARFREALQAGPFLVDHGKAVAGLNASRFAERTVLLADRRGVTALLTTGPVSLAELGEILAAPELWPDLKIDRALNLDGGSSTALWVAANPEPFSRPEWKRVRNAVILAPLAR